MRKTSHGRNQCAEKLNQSECSSLLTHILETNHNKGDTNTMTASVEDKYQVEIEFCERVDSEQVEEEIVTILKRQFLAKLENGDLKTGAL